MLDDNNLRMKKYLSTTSFLLGSLLSASAGNGFKIIGDVTDVADGTTLYLQLVGPPSVRLDSTTIEKGHFEFSGSDRAKPEWALVSIKGQFLPLCDFYLENGNIAVRGSRYTAQATGTSTNEQYNYYNQNINSMFTDIYNMNVALYMAKDSMAKDSLKLKKQKAESVLLDKEVGFVRQHPASPVSLRIVEYICRNAKSEDILRYVSYLSQDLQTTETVVKLKDYAHRQKMTEAGTPAPAFTLKDDKGRKVSLSDFKGKYLLIDFWASWCGPCRASFPAIKELYTRYKSDKFDILGLSLDRKDSAWRKALAEENCPWTQVVDLDGTVANKYAVSTIPLMVLVNPDGTICGKYDKSTIADKLADLFIGK